MSKTRDTGYLANVIQVHDTGVRIMSGSEMLMAISSSGAVTITGELSGSDAANSLLLNGTGSVGFTTTGSFSTASGSASSRLTQIENIYATTGSNSFRATQSITGSLTVTGQIIAQTINVQQVTSSIVYSSGSNVFGCDINSRQTFTGSMFITGSMIVNTTGPELQVNNNGVILGNSTTDRHGVTGSFYQTGSVAIFNSCVGIGTVSPSYQLDMCSGATVNQRIRLQRGSDDTNQNMLIGWNNIAVTRHNVSISGNQTDFSIIQCGSDGARVPFYIGVGGISCFGCSTLVCGNIGLTSTCSKFYQLTNNCKSADSVLDIYNTATDGFGVAIQAGANNNNYALSVTNHVNSPLLHVAGNGLVGINCNQPNARLTINNGSCINAISIYGCNSSYTSQVGFYDSSNVNPNSDGVGGQRIALIEIGTVAGTGTGCRGANMALYTHEANGSLKLPLLLMHTGNVCLVQGNLYTNCSLFAPGTPMQVTAGSTTFTSGNSGVNAGLGAAAAGSTPAYNTGCVILSVNFTPKSATSKILIQTTNISMWEVTNVSDHFYLWASNDTAGTVLTKAGSYLQGFGPNNQNGAIISLNGIANSWGTSTNTISFRVASTGGSDQYQYNPFYGVSGFNADTVGFFGYSIMEIS